MSGLFSTSNTAPAMSAIPLRQRTSTEIVDAALQVFRREPLSFIVGVGLVYVPLFVLTTLATTLGGTALSIVGTAISFVGTMVAYIVAGGVTTLIAGDVYLDRPGDRGAAYRKGASSAGPLALSGFAAGLAIGIGFILLIVPGFYAVARF
ncbi:MAG TPA: hypothetical protein VHV78_16355, partial [Gemmatimonadaceae bacterium]|nr:hypothetical protein [Gemmatimonadaceae bacterium]